VTVGDVPKKGLGSWRFDVGGSMLEVEGTSEKAQRFSPVLSNKIQEVIAP
jgi:hypothetical protein